MSEKMTMQEAIDEANRCLRCAKPLCRKGCPINNNIPEFIHALAEGNIGYAYEIIATKSNLPAICGRVCAQEKQCEGSCILGRKDAAIEIGSLERFIADFVYEHGLNPVPATNGKQGKVAIIGSGPAGLTMAGDLAKEDFDVTVFESLSEPGGVLMFGIPDFRLKKNVVRREIDHLRQLGVKIETNVMIGANRTVDDLFAEGYDAIFMGTGTAMPNILDIPGKALTNIYTATYFLRICTLLELDQLDEADDLIKPGDNVIVIGGGNVALDAARSAIRREADSVTMVYRKTEDKMTGLPSEVEDAKNEGVEFKFLKSPVAYMSKKQMRAMIGERSVIKNIEDDNKVAGIVFDNIVGEGEENCQEILPCDVVILAVGQKAADRIVSTTKGIDVSETGLVITKDRPYGMTTRHGVFSSGDVVHGPKTVVHAMRESKKVAKGIKEYVSAIRLLEDANIHIDRG